MRQDGARSRQGAEQRARAGRLGRRGRKGLTSRISCWLWCSWSDIARADATDWRTTGRERRRDRAANMVCVGGGRRNGGGDGCGRLGARRSFADGASAAPPRCRKADSRPQHLPPARPKESRRAAGPPRLDQQQANAHPRPLPPPACSQPRCSRLPLISTLTLGQGACVQPARVGVVDSTRDFGARRTDGRTEVRAPASTPPAGPARAGRGYVEGGAGGQGTHGDGTDHRRGQRLDRRLGTVARACAAAAVDLSRSPSTTMRTASHAAAVRAVRGLTAPL